MNSLQVASEPGASVPRFPFLLLDVVEDLADEWSAYLFELGAQGVEVRDQTTLLKGQEGKVTLVASFESREEAEAALSEVEPDHRPRIEEVVGDEWLDEWKKYFEPFDICPGIVVRPPWREVAAAEGKQVLELEPGRAFGTGLHETTSLVADALRRHGDELKGATVLDVGCGSGILALVALALGAKTARATDIDPAAVDVTRENALRNHREAQVEADTTDITALDRVYPIVVANIEARVLIPMAPVLMERVAPGGLLILSGVLGFQKDDVAQAYGAMKLLEVPGKGEWVALLLRKEG